MSAYYDYFRALATTHKQVRHNQPNAPGDSVLRRSFFRSRNEINGGQQQEGAHFPALLVPDISGRYHQGSAVEMHNTGVFEVWAKIGALNDENSIEAAKQLCLDIGNNIIAKIYDDFEKGLNTAVIPGFDLNTVTFDYTDTSGTGITGCRFSFAFQKQAFNPYTINFSDYFNES